jgi:hypothetical protein
MTGENSNLLIADSVFWPVLNLTQSLASEHPLDTPAQIAAFAVDMTTAHMLLEVLSPAVVVQVERTSKALQGREPSSLNIGEAAQHFTNNVAAWAMCAQQLVVELDK